MFRSFKKSKELVERYSLKGYLEGPIFCLDENTLIRVFENHKCIKKKLKDLDNDFEVLSYNFNLNKQERQHAKIINRNEVECYEIILEGGRKIIASEEHVFFNDKNEEIKVKDLNVEDKLACMKGMSGVIGEKARKSTLIKISNIHKGKKVSIESRKKMSIAKKGKSTWLKGLTKYTDERIRLLSERAKLRDRSFMLGKNNLSNNPEVIKKIQETKKINGTNKHSLQTKLKIGIANKGKCVGDRNCMHNPIVKLKHLNSVKLAGQKVKELGLLKGSNNPSYGKVYYPILKFNKELNHIVRSRWEEEICLLLNNNNINYIYESKHFKLGNNTYTPDLKLSNNTYIEIKGPLFDKQIEKMKLFIKNYNKKLIIITGKRNFNKLNFCSKLYDYDKFIKGGLINDLQKNIIY